MSLYIGVYVALFAYEAQTEEELNVKPDEILYLLEKSDIDDWWKAKKRVLPVGDEEVDEPVGLVPSNYIEPAPVVKTCTALYDYGKQTEEELSFAEGDRFNIYDLNDPDWLLVGDAATGLQFGFIPSNYVQMDEGATSSTPAVTAPAATPMSFAPPPQHISRQKPQEASPPSPPDQVEDLDRDPVVDNESIEEPEPSLPSRPRPTQQESYTNNYNSIDEPEDAPPMPTRPRGESNVSGRSYENEEDLEAPTQEHSFDGDFFKWYIDEVDGRKKRSVIFAIGKGLIVLKPNQSSPKKLRLRSSSQLDNEWKIKDLTSFNNEKKHLFLEFKNPSASIELHCGSKDVSEAIMSILADLKGAESAKGLREVERASQATAGGSNRKIARLIYDFKAQGDDELGCREGDEVYIINESKSTEWWMCENIDSGRQGVVPSSYLEIVGTSNLDRLTDGPSRRKSTTRSSRHDDRKSHSNKQRNRDRDEREKIREKDRVEREKASSKRDSSDKSMPNYHRVRTWIDSSGSFKVEAEFLGCVEGKIHLHKTNGVKIAVGATKLSIEDLEYVEKVTGTSLEDYKEEVHRQNAKRKAAQEKKQGRKQGRDETPPPPISKSATAAINEIPPPQPSRPKSGSTTQVSEPDYDWFDFFLTCGVDIGNCQRYALNFSREQMDEKIIEDINPSLLRTLGLREGDIIRVMKYLDVKYDRKKQEDPQPVPPGGLFTEPTGALRNNSSSEISKVDAKALPTINKPQSPSTNNSTGQPKFEDDAWAIKPAARSSEDLLKPAPVQQPQYTGSLQDLVNIKPVELASKSSNDKPVPALPNESLSQTPSAPAMTPVKTGNLIQPGDKFGVQKTGNSSIISPQMTGGLVPVQRTGGFVAVQRTGGLPGQMTGGFIAAQPTGFMPITAQPTGFMPIQATGGLPPQFTNGFVSLQTGQMTGGMPPTTFGQPALQTGGMTMPQTTFGQQPMFGQTTGQMPQMPPTSFGQPLSLQHTGPLVPAQRTGPQPQMTGPMPGQMTGQMTGPGMPQTSFGQGFQPQSTFGQNISAPPTFNQGLNQAPQTSFGMPQQGTGFGQQQQPQFGQQGTGFAPQGTGFGQQNTGFGQQMPQTSFGQFPQPQPQPQQSFGQFGQNMNQMTNQFQNTGISSPPFNQQMPNTTFGAPQQPQFEGFGQLQSQPTGSGFGNAPLQQQPTGKRANLQTATPDNPFGF